MEAAVRRPAPDVAAHVAERHAAVLSPEFRGPSEVVDGNAPVSSVQLEQGRARHLDLEADGPMLARGGAGTVGANRAGRLDVHTGHQTPRIGFRVGAGHDPGAHQDVTAVPSADADPPVATGIDIERVRAADGGFANFTPRGATIVRAAAAPGVGEGPGSLGLGLSKTGGHKGRREDSGETQRASHHDPSYHLDGGSGSCVYSHDPVDSMPDRASG